MSYDFPISQNVTPFDSFQSFKKEFLAHKLYTKQMAGQIWPTGQNQPTTHGQYKLFLKKTEFLFLKNSKAKRQLKKQAKDLDNSPKKIDKWPKTT